MSELMVELRELIITMCKLLGDDNDDGIDMVKTCGAEELHKARKIRHGHDRTKDK